MLPDMGAYERPLFSLVALGLDDGPPVWLPPYGALLVGATAAVQAVLPIGTAWSFTVPSGAAFVGQPFAVQGLGLAGSLGGLTAVDRNVLR